jgi:hypothetical protein
MKNEFRMDRVYIFGDQLSFLVPHEWAEEDVGEENYYQYHEPGTDSGWCRVSLVTTKLRNEKPSEHLSRWIIEHENAFIEEKTGNRIRTSEKHRVDGGEQLSIYFWYVLNVVAPDSVYEAVFS